MGLDYLTFLGEDSQTNTWRYLGQVANMVFFDDPQQDIELKRMLRNYVHYLPEVKMKKKKN